MEESHVEQTAQQVSSVIYSHHEWKQFLFQAEQQDNVVTPTVGYFSNVFGVKVGCPGVQNMCQRVSTADRHFFYFARHFLCVTQNGQKMTQNGQKMTKNGQKMTQNGKNDPKLPQMA